MAGFVSVAIYVTAAHPSRAPIAPVPTDAVRMTFKPAPVPIVKTSIGRRGASPRAEQLIGIVARRYRVAKDAATEVVHAAFVEGRRYGLDPTLILAVIAVESRFNPFAASEQGALGLMQIVPRFHRDKMPAAPESMLSPQINIALGARILKDAIQRGGSDVAGLQLYNGSYDDETRAYANRVMSERRRIEEALPKPRA